MRTDIHSEKNLKPENYRVIRYIYTALPNFTWNIPAFANAMRDFRAVMNEVLALLAEKGANIHASWSQCDHCGAHFHHGVLMEHVDTGELITVGWICADQRFSLDNVTYEKTRMEKYIKAIRIRRNRRIALRKFVAAHPIEARLLSKYRTDNFFRSLRGQLIYRGELTERQMAALLVSAARQERFENERAAREAARAAEPKNPSPEGKVEVEGEVLHTRSQDSEWGIQYKMLVKADGGFRVWSTVPRAILDRIETGSRIRFTATLKRSPDDESFAFASRPSRADIVGPVTG